MKTIEEKAKAYDEIIERAKTMLAAGEVMYGKENNASQLITDIIPELKESEDERIRKALVKQFGGCIKDHEFCNTGFTYADITAWLERQKEQKPIEFKNDELVEIIKGEFEGFRRLLKKKGIDYEPQYGYWEGFARLFDSSAREYVKEQKPAWSEEDEEMLWSTINGLNQDIYEKERNWLANRLKYLRPQPKQEWNEKDEKNFSSLCEFFTTWSEKHYTAYGRQEAMEKWLFNRFKSLRPSWKPSEEQMNTIRLAIQVLNSSGHNSLCCKLNALRDDLLKQK